MVAMDVFPAIYSTLSPQALIKSVLSEYELSAIARCLFWHRGLSDVYLVETEERSYILKISHHHWRSRSDIEFELEFLDFLHQNQLPIANPLKTKADKLYVTVRAVEGNRFAALFPYAPGEIPQGDLTIEQSTVMGQTLATLHQTALDFNSATPRQALNIQYLLDDSLAVIKPYLDNRDRDLSYLEDTIYSIEQQLACLAQTAPLWSVCWGDPHSGNVHFTTGDRITLFDFDQCGYGWRIFDLAKFLQVSLNAGIKRKTRDAFFAGYQQIQQLTDAETHSLQALTQMAQIWQWAISIRASTVHNWARIDDLYVNRHLNQLKRLGSNGWQLF